MIRFFLSAIFVFISVGVCSAQTPTTAALRKSASNQTIPAVKQSPAYAELLLRKTEREAQLEEFLVDYTEEFPKVKEAKFEIELLGKQIDKISTLSVAEAPKLSLALGKLLVRKTELEVDLWNLLRQYNADHPDVKRARRKVEVYEKAVREILP